MKKLIYIILIVGILSIGFIFFTSFENNKFIQQHSNIVLNIAGDSNFPPYEYIDKNGSYTGFNVDIMRAIALQTGIEIRFYPMPWQDACEKLKVGDIDIIQGMKFTKERSLYYDFSKEYLENSQSIFVHIENDDIDKFNSLNHKKVAVQQGDMVVSYLEKLKGVHIFYSRDQEDAMNKVLNKEVDAYIGNTLTGVFLMNKEGIRDKIKITGETLNPTKYAVAVKKGDIETLNIVNKGLDEIKKNGTYDKIYRKWFGQPMQFTRSYIRSVMIAAYFLALAFMIGIFIFYRWNYILKKEVMKQTHALNTANENLINKNLQIKEERDFREKILNQIFSGIITMNKNGIITFTNKLADCILQTKEDCLVGKHCTNTPIKAIFHSNILSNESNEREIVICNEKRIIHYKTNMMHRINENMEETTLIFRDVTEERWMQEKIKTKDKLQSLGNLISGIAHEIRNPLTSIKTYAALIPKKFDNPKFREMISQDIPLEIDRLNSLISDLLEYSRPKKPFKERINLWNAVNRVLLLLKNNIKKENIQVKINIPREAFIYMDKNHLRQILINIFLNAIESMDREEKKIVVSSKCMENIEQLSICDTGSGIEENSLNKIYNPFYTTKPTGTGLGLFVSYQLLMENNADIQFHSIKGVGTTCTIKFKKWEED